MKTFASSLILGAAIIAASTEAALSANFDLLDHTSQLNYYHPANTAYTAAQTALPSECRVDQVHIASRHMTRYMSKGSYSGVAGLANRFSAALAAGLPIASDDMQFLKDWKLTDLVTNNVSQPENITALGLEEGKAFGRAIREKYPDLYSDKTTLWTGNVERVVLTAKSFMDGYFGPEAAAGGYKNLVITNSTDKSLGGNTVLPIDTCPNFVKDTLADKPSAEFKATFTTELGARIGAKWPGLNFTGDDALGMMDLCMYQMNLVSKTDRRFCNIFTDQDWINYGYNKDIGYYYGSSYGNPLARTVGYPYVEAVASLLAQPTTPFCQSVFVAFTHDTQINVFISALGLAYDATFPSDKVNSARNYRSSRLVPMGARLITERIKCGSKRYVRVSVNEAVHAIPDCQSGPGLSCPLEDYTKKITALKDTVGDFATKCGVTSGASSKLELFNQPLRNQCAVNSC